MPAATTIPFERLDAFGKVHLRASFAGAPSVERLPALIAPRGDGEAEALALCEIALTRAREAAVVINARSVVVGSNPAFRAAQDFFGPVVGDIVTRLARNGQHGPRCADDRVTLCDGERDTFGMWFGSRGQVRALFRVRPIAMGDRFRMIALRQPGQALTGCDPALLEQMLGLTPSEARLACALVKCKSLPLAIRELGLKDKTGRTYLDRIFSKTGLNSQLQLYAMLTELSLLSRESV